MKHTARRLAAVAATGLLGVVGVSVSTSSAQAASCTYTNDGVNVSAACTDDVADWFPVQGQFRVKYKCVGDSSWHYGPWEPMVSGATSLGTCPPHSGVSTYGSDTDEAPTP